MNSEPTQTRLEFIPTKEYRRFAEFCDACRREQYIGLCFGPPGIGKTLSARHYTRWGVLEPLLDPFSEAPYSTLSEAQAHTIRECRAILYTPTVANSANGVLNQVKRLRRQFDIYVGSAIYWDIDDKDTPPNMFDDRCELLIVDEADRLKTPSLEQMRDIYDRNHMGLVLIGMPGLEKRLARYPQLYSRIGFSHAYRPLSQAEVRFILEKHWQRLGMNLNEGDFTDTEAIAAIIRITNGNFRLLNRLLVQIKRVLQINQLSTITKEAVEAARECLVIGSI